MNFPTGLCECCQLPSVECFCPGHEGECNSQWKELFSGKTIHPERGDSFPATDTLHVVTKPTYLDALDIVADLLQRRGFGTPIDRDGVVELVISSFEKNHCRRFVKFICTPDGADEIMDGAFRAAHERRKRG